MIRAAPAMIPRRTIHSTISNRGLDGTSATGIGRIAWAFSRGANRTPMTPKAINPAMTA
ncbi:hypothetical protein D3C72_2381120 [compost metagenome]